MAVLLLTALQVLYLPPAPPRQPITDPMFASSPVRELRRQWDDCVFSVRQLILMNGVTEPDRASGMLDFCAEYEDQLTGALVAKFGFTKATSAMKKARVSADADLKKLALQVGEYVRAHPAPPPKPAPKPRYTVFANDTGCGSEYLTGTGASERALGFFYDKRDDNRFEPKGKLTFGFKDDNLLKELGNKRRSVRFSVTVGKAGSTGRKTLTSVPGVAFANEGYVVVVTDVAGALKQLVYPPADPKSFEISGPWANPVQFDAEDYGVLIGDVENCARKDGKWAKKN